MGWGGPVQVIGDPVAQQGRHELKIFLLGEVVVGVRQPRHRVRASQRFRQLQDLARRHVFILSALDDEGGRRRSEEHTSELQSQSNLVCRLLLEKKKKKKQNNNNKRQSDKK